MAKKGTPKSKKLSADEQARVTVALERLDAFRAAYQSTEDWPIMLHNLERIAVSCDVDMLSMYRAFLQRVTSTREGVMYLEEFARRGGWEAPPTVTH